jgi:hypothetical protein
VLFSAFPPVQSATPFVLDQTWNIARTGTSEEHMAWDSLLVTPERVGGCWICANVFLHQQKPYKRRNKVHAFTCHQLVMHLHAYQTKPKPLLIRRRLSSRRYSAGHLLVRKYQVCFTTQYYLIRSIFRRKKYVPLKDTHTKTRKHIHGCSKSLRPHVV